MHSSCTLFKFVVFILIYIWSAQAIIEDYPRFVRQVTEPVPELTRQKQKPPAKAKNPLSEQYILDIRQLTKSICVGAYIKGFANTHAVTKASCISKVKMSDLRVYMREGEHTQHIRGVEKIHLHPKYKPGDQAYDIALLQLEKNYASAGKLLPINNNDKIYPKCALHYVSSGKIKKHDAKMIPCPDSPEIQETYICLEGLGSKCYKDLHFVVECELKLCGLEVDKAACRKGKIYGAIGLIHFESFINTGQDSVTLEPHSMTENDTVRDTTTEKSRALVSFAHRFAYFTLFSHVLHMY